MTRLAAWIAGLLLVTSTMIAFGREPVESITIAHGDLKADFRDNSRSPQILSGVTSLVNTKAAPNFDAFDPDTPGASAGLNFEHIISGHRNPNNKFTPRMGPYRLYREPDGRSVILIRRAADSPWNVASSLKYTLTAPHYVDFEFRCTPRDAAHFRPQQFAIFFFANYMNDVIDPAIHFRGLREEDQQPQWIAADAPQNHPDWNGGGTYRGIQADPLPYDDDVEFRLNTWAYDWPRIEQPFYYGRAKQDMTLLLMFDRLSSTRDQIRFSLFKFKLPRLPRPAWDFQYVINQVQPGETYGFRGRLVWKKFVSVGDCQREFDEWSNAIRKDRILKLRQLGAAVFTDGDEVVEVNANGTRLTNEQMQWVASFSDMTDLSLERTQVDDRGISRLEYLPKLEWLNLYQCPVGDKTLAQVSQYKQLQHLPIGGSRVTDLGLRYLRNKKNLLYLGLKRTAISDQGLANLKGLTNLTGLHLGATKVSDGGMSNLRSMKRLKRLWLDETELTDASIEHLVRLTSLRELHLRKTKITQQGFAKLREALPECDIINSESR